jgi:molecular chaperone GrpE
MTEEHNQEEKILDQQAPIEPAVQEPEDDYKNKYLLLLADMENTRKRMSREKIESVKYSLDNIVSDLLTPLDNLENALKHTKNDNASAELKNWALGFEMILNQFKDSLAEHGVKTFDSLGAKFDPHQHQALEMITSEGPEGVVLEECVKGYKREDRIIRHAQVKVSKKTNPIEET